MGASASEARISTRSLPPALRREVTELVFGGMPLGMIASVSGVHRGLGVVYCVRGETQNVRGDTVETDAAGNRSEGDRAAVGSERDGRGVLSNVQY